MLKKGQTDNQEGNQEDGFLKAFEEYNNALFRHACARLNNRERALDLVYDTFTKVWLYLKAGHEINSYRSFLYKVLNNLIIDEYRKQKEVSLDNLLEMEGVDEGSFLDLQEDTEASLIDKLDGKKAFSLVKELPEVYREVIILRFADGLGPKEISSLIEESENVVSVRLFRGLKMLREKVNEKMNKKKTAGEGDKKAKTKK